MAGFVQSYGRPLTEALINGLEVIPRKAVNYRGTRLEQMDLDAVLRRRPEIALVDELDLFVFHGFTEFWLAGRRWVKATPAFNIELCERFGVAGR